MVLEDLAARNTIQTPLDPLLHVLSREYVDDKDLTARLRKLFQVLTDCCMNSVTDCKCEASIGTESTQNHTLTAAVDLTFYFKTFICA